MNNAKERDANCNQFLAPVSFVSYTLIFSQTECFAMTSSTYCRARRLSSIDIIKSTSERDAAGMASWYEFKVRLRCEVREWAKTTAATRMGSPPRTCERIRVQHVRSNKTLLCTSACTGISRETELGTGSEVAMMSLSRVILEEISANHMKAHMIGFYDTSYTCSPSS